MSEPQRQVVHVCVRLCGHVYASFVCSLLDHPLKPSHSSSKHTVLGVAARGCCCPKAKQWGSDKAMNWKPAVVIGQGKTDQRVGR